MPWDVIFDQAVVDIRQIHINFFFSVLGPLEIKHVALIVNAEIEF